MMFSGYNDKHSNISKKTHELSLSRTEKKMNINNKYYERTREEKPQVVGNIL